MAEFELGQQLAIKAAQSKDIHNQFSPVEVFRMGGEESCEYLQRAIGRLEIREVVDEYPSMLEEVYFSRHATDKYRYKTAEDVPSYKSFVGDLLGDKPLWETGAWVYYPWSGKLVHFLPEDLHYELRTSRNNDAVLPAEQDKFRKFNIGVAGLSIGQAVAYTVAIGGGSNKMNLADRDTISGTNTNRIRAGFDSLGLNKAVYLSRLIYELNPYAQLTVFADGVTEVNIGQFFEGIDALADEVDDFPTKVRLLEEARVRRIPVVRAADIFDGVQLDVERYDLHPDQPLFNGKLDKEDIKMIMSPAYSPREMIPLFLKLNDGNGKNQRSRRLQRTASLMGVSLSGAPQLGGTAFMGGAIASYVLRRIACGEGPDSCSIRIDLDNQVTRRTGDEHRYLRRIV